MKVSVSWFIINDITPKMVMGFNWFKNVSYLLKWDKDVIYAIMQHLTLSPK